MIKITGKQDRLGCYKGKCLNCKTKLYVVPPMLEIELGIKYEVGEIKDLICNVCGK